MARSSVYVFIVALLLAAPAAERAVAQQSEYELTEITDGVYMFRYQAHNGMFVVTGDGVLVFDPINPTAARIFRQEIANVTSEPISAIVYSHHHADHVSGANEIAQGVPIIAHALARKHLTEDPNPEIPPPTRTFTDEMTLVIGDTEIHLVYLGPNHSDNSIIAHLPDKGVIFAVDFVSNDRVGYRDLPGFHFPGLWNSLERLQELDYTTAVFGHGPPGTKGDVYEQINYWTDLRHWAEMAIQAGLSEDEAVDGVDLPHYEGWGGYENWFKMNARTIYKYYADGM